MTALAPSRLVLVATNKGGVGKSTTMIHIADYLLEHNHSFIAFDPDHANASFARFFRSPAGTPLPFVRFINIADDRSLDQMTKVLDDNETNLVLVDGVAAQTEVFLNWIDDIDLFERAKEKNLAITFLLIIDEDKDTVDQATAVVDRVGEKVDYIVVRNLKNTAATTIYDQSPARKFLRETYHGKEITLPKLKDHLVALIQRRSLRLSQAETDPDVYENDRQRISGYRKKITQEIDSILDYLLPPATRNHRSSILTNHNSRHPQPAQH